MKPLEILLEHIEELIEYHQLTHRRDKSPDADETLRTLRDVQAELIAAIRNEDDD